MDHPAGEGPDGRSIRPVSSLLAKFENLTKSQDGAPAGPTPPPTPSIAINIAAANSESIGTTVISSAPASRNPSPGLKPDRLREATREAASTAPNSSRQRPPVPKTRPKDKALQSLQHVQIFTANQAASSPASAQRAVLLPPVSPRPVRPPSVLVEPPHSPPKRVFETAPTSDQLSFLGTDSLVKPPSPAGPRQFKTANRANTPVIDPQKSPRLTVSQPPSPPPPRRSAELCEMRRERDARDMHRPTPPPINRADKPHISPGRWPHAAAESPHGTPRQIEFTSPFGSPPSSASGDSPIDEDVPLLPVRPGAPQQHHQNQGDASFLASSKTGSLNYEPPPVRHAIASRRRDKQEADNSPRASAPPQLTGDLPPALPARSVGITAATSAGSTPTGSTTTKTVARTPGQGNVNGAQYAALAPPRPPRTGLSVTTLPTTALTPPVQSLELMPQKRVSSTPTQMGHANPPPSRTHGRSMTVDRTSSRVPSEFRVPATPVVTPSRTLEVPPIASPAGGSALQTMTVEESQTQVSTTLPDTTSTNRSMPYITKGVHELATKHDCRVVDVCGELVCMTGSYTRVWSLLDGVLLMSLAMSEGAKGTAVAFKPAPNVDEEGTRIWIGNAAGELLEADVGTRTIICTRPSAHGRHEIIRIYRQFNELWTLDEAGTLHVWAPDPTRDGSVPDLAQGPSQTHRVPRGHTFSMVVSAELWHAAGKEIRVFQPSSQQFQVLLRALTQDRAGTVTSGTTRTADPDRVFFGHSDGKVTIYSRRGYTCLEVVSVSMYKITSLVSVGDYLWAGYNSGRVCVYDIAPTPWAVRKDWQAHAHESPIIKLAADAASFYRLDRFPVVSVGADNMIRAWDGLLQTDWLEREMQSRDADYCEFEQIRALFLTWNAGASTPNSLRYSDSDAHFVENLLRESGSPDLFVFGFQELVDLEDKKATAKRFLKPKKKEGSDQERMSHRYRDWRDFLVRSLDDHMGGDLYHLLHSAPLVGLFTCIFVRADLRDRITNLSSAEVKRGLAGLHGNKGAVVVRFMIDDTSLCLINCHLAAGQNGANQRHADMTAILEATLLPPERDPAARIDSYVGGGDGSMILDHELCVLNGDLNYRIDTMSRDTVVAAVKQGNLQKLLERDQLLVARRRREGFRLRAFEEMPICFAPTYKYDVGTDRYDTSEKKRSPAWCDRLLYRARPGRIEQLDYRRHEVRVSDHRPVSGCFHLTAKRVSPKLRAQVWMECQQRWDDVREAAAQREKLFYLTSVIGYDAATAKDLIRDRSPRQDQHSSSIRHRE